MHKFSDWLVKESKDIFGFERELRPEKKDPRDTQPINAFDIEKIIENLARHNIGPLQPEIKFVNEIVWGNESGAIRVSINSWLNVVLERKTTDLAGRGMWIAKKVYQLNHNQFGGAESQVSQEILQEVENVYKAVPDSANREYKELQNLVIAITGMMKRNAHDIFVFQGIRRINENNYIIRFGLRGHGVQRKGQKRVEENHTQVTFDQNSGLIRLTNYNIESPLGEHKWAVTQKDVDWYFAPNQNKSEIAQTISTTMHWY